MQQLGRAILYGVLGILCAATAILLAVACTTATKRVLFVNRALRADGAIVDVRCPQQSTRHGYQCRPVFRFTAVNGQTYLVLSPTGGNFTDFRLGQPVPVLYLQDHPESARIGSFRHLWASSLVFAFLGAVIAIFPIQLVRGMRRQRRMMAGLTQLS
jgi:hypothetical protein